MSGGWKVVGWRPDGAPQWQRRGEPSPGEVIGRRPARLADLLAFGVPARNLARWSVVTLAPLPAPSARRRVAAPRPLVGTGGSLRARHLATSPRLSLPAAAVAFAENLAYGPAAARARRLHRWRCSNGWERVVV